MENDRLLEKVKEYFNEHFDERDRKLEAIEKKLNEVLGQNEDLKKSNERIEQTLLINLDLINDNLRENNTFLQSVQSGGMTFLLQLESLRKYVQDLARVNGWKLPEKRREPRKVE